jgi:hypothetical protein
MCYAAAGSVCAGCLVVGDAGVWSCAAAHQQRIRGLLLAQGQVQDQVSTAIVMVGLLWAAQLSLWCAVVLGCAACMIWLSLLQNKLLKPGTDSAGGGPHLLFGVWAGSVLPAVRAGGSDAFLALACWAWHQDWGTQVSSTGAASPCT